MLEVENLSFAYDRENVFEDVCFSAKPGEVTVLLGANGAGKTTLLKCISGLESAKGTVYLCNKNTAKMTRRKSAALLSYLSQSTDCAAELNVYEVILLGRLQQLSFKVSDEDMSRVQEVMELLSITQFANRRISELSGGQRQLVFIAQTLIKNPKILVLDEPTSALDLNHQFRLMDLIKKITQERQLTTLVTLHHLDVAVKYADHIVILSDRTVYSDGTPDVVINCKMLKDVYKIDSEIYTDENNAKHVIALGSTEKEIK